MRGSIIPLKIIYYMMKRIINTTGAPAAVGTYSQAVEAKGILFVSGQIGLDPATGKLAGGDAAEQAEQALKNTGAILEAAGYGFHDVVRTTCILSDMSDFKALNEVYGKYYTLNPPARATYAVKSLPLGALVEIETIAMK
jgi:2-iminobutanoate/2-iminopropanoate deaminase